MSKEFLLSEEAIFAAERARASGNKDAAVEATGAVMEFPIESFGELPDSDKKKFLMAARIYVVANNSKARESWTANGVLRHLRTTRRAIVNVYHDPAVSQTASEIKEDTKGNPYEFDTEMARDEFAYAMTLAAFTGNTAHIDDAVERLSMIIANAEEPSAKMAGAFEADRILFKTGPRLAYLIFKDSFEKAVDASANIGRWERVATVAARYCVDCAREGMFSEAARGVKEWAKAAIADRSTSTILPREVIKGLTDGLRHYNWRITRSLGVDYSSLKLP